MPHKQSSLIKGRIFHYKVPFPLNFTSLKKILQVSCRPEVFYKKGVLRNFAKLTGKHLCQRFLFKKVAGLIKKKTLTQCVFL